MKQFEKAPCFCLEFLTLLRSDIKTNAVADLKAAENLAIQRTDVDSSYMTPRVGRLTTYLTVKHIIEINGAVAQEATASYSAHFRQTGPVNADDLVRFAGIRAPELIFPFVKDTIATLTSGSITGPVFLSQVDFVQICTEKMPRN